jgi:methylmalonyl-CoA mutase
MALRDPRTYASNVTEEQTVEGGLAEPEELEPDQGSLDLAGPEDRHDRAEWEAAAAAVLRKARRLGEDDPDDLVWEKLTRQTLDGIGISPLGTPELVADLSTRGRPTRAGAWDVRAHLADGPEELLHDEALADLEGGVTSLWVEVHPGTDYGVLLDGVLLDLAPVVLDARTDDAATAARFLAWSVDRELHPGTNLGVRAAEATRELHDAAAERGILAFVVDASEINSWGGSDVQELAWAMATGVGHLRAMAQAGVALEDAAARMEFRVAVTDEQFTSIAKLRSARRLWQRVQELCGTEAAPMRLHAVTSRSMMTRYDPWVNMLRTTVAAFAAGVGGADAVTVLPFDSAIGRPDAFGRRIARNTSHLLIDESHVAVVSDPAGGAYVTEKLTDDLALAAWELFGRLDDGEDLRPLVDATAAAREQQVATRRRPLTGVSEFPNLAEQLPERPSYLQFDGIRGYADSFEALRDHPPAGHVFLATMGSVAAHTARATFAANLLAAGGVAVDVAGPTETVEELVAAYDGQKVVCLAGSDGAYEAWADEAVGALREAGAAWVVIAGRPRDSVDDSAAMGVDALDFLRRTRERLA